FEPMAREFHTGQGVTSIVFAVTAFCFFGLGAVSGPIADRVGPRRVVLVGALAMGAGLAATAVTPAFWVGCASYGLGVGIGTACGYVPMVAAVGGWFERRRSLAIGIAVSGIGVGTLAVPPLAAVLVQTMGWRQTYLVMAVASTLILIACALAAQAAPRRQTPAPGRLRPTPRPPSLPLL